MRKEFFEGFFKRADFTDIISTSIPINPIMAPVNAAMTATKEIKNSINNYYSTCVQAGNSPELCSMDLDDVGIHY